MSNLVQVYAILGPREAFDGSDAIPRPAMLKLCTGAPWFPPLTVTTPMRNLPLMPMSMPDKAHVRIKRMFSFL